MSRIIHYDCKCISEDTPREQMPDRYSAGAGMPEGNFVVARGNDMSVLSVYGDNVWDWTNYTPHKTPFSLDYETLRGNKSNVQYDSFIAEAKLLIFTVTWLANDSGLSPATTSVYLRLIKKLISYGADEKGLMNALQDEQFINQFIKSESGFYSTFMLALYAKLQSASGEVLAIKIPSKKIMDKIRKKSQEHYKSHLQHPPIPTRIYLNMLKALSQFIKDSESFLPDLINLAEQIYNSPLLGMSEKMQREIFKQDGTPREKQVFKDNWKELLDKQSEPLKKFLLSKTTNHNRKAVHLAIAEVFYAVKVTLLAYTGARYIEIDNLREGCLEVKIVNRKEVFIVTGVTSKLNRGIAKTAKWVTSMEAAAAVKVSEKLSSALYSLSGENEKNKMLIPYRLFTLNRNTKGNLPTSGGNYLGAGFRYGIYKDMAIDVNEDDISDLELIDPFRNWRADKKIKKGKCWPITAHQFRRSLALYASTSGLVTLPSLKRQLQHLTEAMSAYYSRGSGRAIDLLGDGSDFIEEYNNAQPESEVASYVKNVLLSDERMFGAHGNWINKDKGERKVVYLGARENLQQQFKNRKMAYQETMLGGCTTTSPCKEKAMRNIVACLDCSGAVIKPERLNRVIESQRVVVKNLDEKSIEYRIESEDLSSMLKYKKRIKGKE